MNDTTPSGSSAERQSPPTAAADVVPTSPETAEPQTLGGTPCSPGFIPRRTESGSCTQSEQSPCDTNRESVEDSETQANRRTLERYLNPCPDYSWGESDISRRLQRSLLLWQGLGHPAPVGLRFAGPHSEWVPVLEGWLDSLVLDFFGERQSAGTAATGPNAPEESNGGCSATPCSRP